MAKNPSKVVEKFQRRVAGAGEDYKEGVKNPAKDWLDGYVDSAERMAIGIQEALAEGRHIKRAQAAGTETWQDASLKKGASRYTGAAGEAAAGYAKVAQDVIAAGEQARQAANKLPNTTQEQRIQRAVASMQAISAYWKQKKG